MNRFYRLQKAPNCRVLCQKLPLDNIARKKNNLWPSCTRTSCFLTPTKCPSQYSLDPPVTRRRSKMHSQFPWWVIVKNGGSKASNHVPMWVTPPCHSNHETFHATGATDRRSMVVQSQHGGICDKQTSNWCRSFWWIVWCPEPKTATAVTIASKYLNRSFRGTFQSHSFAILGKDGSTLHVVVEVQSYLSSFPNIEDASK